MCATAGAGITLHALAHSHWQYCGRAGSCGLYPAPLCRVACTVRFFLPYCPHDCLACRKALGLRPVESFTDITPDVTISKTLKQLYGTPNNIGKCSQLLPSWHRL